MLPELVQRSNLFLLLHKLDQDLTNQYRQKDCPFCKGPLHQANYERKPRGAPESLPEDLCIRQSLCCGREDCRRRTLPPSCLFMGRRVYWGAVILVVMTLRQNRPEGAGTKWLIGMFGISRKTLIRWITYYREVFPQSAQWKKLRGRVGVYVGNDRLPGDLVDYFVDHCDCAEEGLIRCLYFLAGAADGL
ncbi:MAG: hypothetical protein ACE5I0_04515 [Candidatus Binatia bacterium]